MIHYAPPQMPSNFNQGLRWGDWTPVRRLEVTPLALHKPTIFYQQSLHVFDGTMIPLACSCMYVLNTLRTTSFQWLNASSRPREYHRVSPRLSSSLTYRLVLLAIVVSSYLRALAPIDWEDVSGISIPERHVASAATLYPVPLVPNLAIDRCPHRNSKGFF